MLFKDEMEIIVLVVLVILAKNIKASHCNKELNYHDNYGYGIDITCERLSNKNEEILQSIMVSNEIELKIIDSNLTNVTQNLFQNVAKIRYLRVLNSTFSFNLNEELFSNLIKLQHLTVKNTKFNLHSYVFQGLDELEELNMINVSLNAVKNNTFTNLRKIETLRLTHNKFKNLLDIYLCDLLSLKYLDVNYNEIEIIQQIFLLCFVTENESTFQLNGMDYEVKYQSDRIYHQAIARLNLIELNLSNNKIKKIEGFDWSPKLKYLDLSYNLIKSFDENVFSVLVDLEKIDLDNNLLVNIEPKTFSFTKHLRYINLNRNKITLLWLNNLLELEEIDLSGNRISSQTLPNLNNLPKLNTLLLCNNFIHAIPKNFFHNFPSLELLDLSSNSLVLERDSFRYLSKLTKLIIQNNNLEKFPFSVFQNLTDLQFLDISMNKISVISDDSIFNDLVNLQLLNMSHNLIEELSYELVKPLRNLQVLDMSGNKLHNFQINLISLLPSLRVINIKSNLLSCEILADIIRFLKSKEITYTINEDFEYHKTSIDGIYCKKISGSGREGNSMSKNEGFSQISAFGILSIVVLCCVIVSFVSYKCFLYTKRRRYIMDEVELL